MFAPTAVGKYLRPHRSEMYPWAVQHNARYSSYGRGKRVPDEVLMWWSNRQIICVHPPPPCLRRNQCNAKCNTVIWQRSADSYPPRVSVIIVYCPPPPLHRYPFEIFPSTYNYLWKHIPNVIIIFDVCFIFASFCNKI
jgi:hypothetical protein